MTYMALAFTEQSKVGQRLLGKKTITVHNESYVVVQGIWPNGKGTTQPYWDRKLPRAVVFQLRPHKS